MAEANVEISKWDKFLGCYVGPVNAGDRNAEMFRWHVTTVLISRVARFNVTQSIPSIQNFGAPNYAGFENDVTDIIEGLHRAQRKIRSNVTEPSDESFTPVATATPPAFVLNDAVFTDVKDEYERLSTDRTNLSVQVAVLRNLVLAAKPGLRHEANELRRILGLFSGSLSETIKGLKSLAVFVRKVNLLKGFSKAYRTSAQKHLHAVMTSGKPPADKDWKSWNDAFIDACTDMAKTIEGSTNCAVK